MKKKNLWSGRFAQSMAQDVLKFSQSIIFDKRLAEYDIKASMAHVQMLNKCKIISLKDKDLILMGLKKILSLMEQKKFTFKQELEDVHMNIESFLINLIGETGKKMHTARSRNDQVLVDVYLYLKDTVKRILGYIQLLQKTLLNLAEKNRDLIMPGYTHLQQAQPILVSHYFLSHFFSLQRDKERFKQNEKSLDILPLGVGALAGVNYTTDRKYLAQLLGFSKVSENSIDTVSNRDFMIEFIFNSALCAVHLSRLAEDLILWNTEEFNFIEIADAFTTGSSIMPNKKNPDILELIRGKTSHFIGYANSVLVLLKGLPLAYNRDLQEDKVILFNTIDTFLPILYILPKLLNNLKFKRYAIEKKMKSGFMLATDIADFLVKKGVAFRTSHHIAGKVIKYCVSNQKNIFELNLDELKKVYSHFNQEIFSILNYKNSIKTKLSEGSTSYKSVRQQISKAKKLL